MEQIPGIAFLCAVSGALLVREEIQIGVAL